MNAVDEIFGEYRNLRDHDVAYNDALRLMRPHIEPLLASEKNDLVKLITAFEKRLEEAKSKSVQANTQPDQQSSNAVTQVGQLKRLSSQKPNTNTREFRSVPPMPTTPETTAEMPATSPNKQLMRLSEGAAWVTCANCGKKNRKKEPFCYSCGHILADFKGKHDTKQFEDANSKIFDTHYYDLDSVLVLWSRKSGNEYELRPQSSDHELIIGRVTSAAVTPDVDLSAENGEELGVSRLHLAVKHDPKANTIIVYDLGSANGTFINGQKLHPKEERILRSEDDLRLGRLVLRVRFLHPGEEIS
ncbi:MAG: FHA domain-containing protein [Aggregatilineales bacterium]